MASQIVEPIHFPDKIDRKSPLLGSLFLFFVLVITFLFVYVLYICAHRHRHRRNTNISPPRAGLDPTTISSLPVSAIKNNPSLSQAAAECAICLSMFQEGEKVKVLPICRHGFHSDCVDQWLRTRSSCPLCRGRVDSQSRELDSGMRLP